MRYQLQIDLINQTVRGEQKPFRELEEWEEMEAQFRELRSRYKFFVLDGASRTGKVLGRFGSLEIQSRSFT